MELNVADGHRVVGFDKNGQSDEWRPKFVLDASGRDGALAGDIFGNRAIMHRLIFFRLIYGISWLLTLRESYQAWRRRLRSAALGHVDFAAG